MAGGLINIVSYVSNDLYLTGAPQISFYKMVYRRYTNFAKESIYVDFNDAIKFGHESELIPPRIGDLIKDSVLHISIPNISITNQDVGIDTSDIQYTYINNNEVSDYESIINVYMVVLVQIYRIVCKAVSASNVSLTGLIQDVQTYVNTGTNLSILEQYDSLISKTQQELKDNSDPRASLFGSTSNLWTIITNIDVNKLITMASKQIDTTVYTIDSVEYIQQLQTIMKNNIKKQIDIGLEYCKEIQNYYFTTYKNFISTTTNDKNKNIKCAWVKNLGHSIIEYVDIHIGGKRIDRHWGIWMNIWYQLTYKEAQKEIYNEMLGNIPILTNFDNQEKPAYELYIPLTFWFNKFNGLSFPLIAMQYHDIRFTVKLRKLEEVFFIERLYKADLNGSEVVLTANLIDFLTNRAQYSSTLTNIEMIDDIILSDIWDSKGKNLGGHIMIDYIYLESPERKRFAQSGHEYLIERMQYDNFKNINQTQFDVQLDFTNPSKEIIWIFSKDIYTQNIHSWNECRWHDFATTNGKGNPILSTSLSFNNYVRIQKQNGMYFNIFQPLIYHKVSPDDGINMYSFCLEPKQHQPTGACNFSKITDIRFFMTIDEMFYRYIDADIYPYDSNIDFKFNITDINTLLDNIDIEYVRRIIRDYTLATNNTNLSVIGSELINSSVLLQLFQDANSTLYVYEQLATGNTVEISMSAYRRLIQKTQGTCFVFNLTMNILRLIGGYGALAYSGNS
jgi:hypothetical protein